ncbi:MAG: TerB family tellurite resistance protein [Alphaproteobacteria bacterium]
MSKPSAQPGLKPVSDSFFHMWRCIIVMAHADGVIHEKEQEFFDKVFTNMARVYALTPEHLEAFAGDLKKARDIDTLMHKVKEPECRSLLLYFSQVVAWIDGHLSPDESDLLKKLHAAFGKAPETGEVMARIRQDIADQMFKRKADLEQKHLERNPLFYALDALLLRLGVDLLD